MCSCNGHCVNLLIGAEVAIHFSEENKRNLYSILPDYDYDGKLEHTKIASYNLKKYFNDIKICFKKTRWDNFNDIEKMLINIQIFLTKKVPNLKFKYLTIPTWNVCKKCCLPRYLYLVDWSFCRKYKNHIFLDGCYSSTDTKEENEILIYNFKHIHDLHFLNNYSRDKHWKYKMDRIIKKYNNIKYIYILKNKFKKFQKLKMLMIIKFNSLVSRKIFSYIGNLYLINFNIENEKKINWLKNQIDYLEDKYE